MVKGLTLNNSIRTANDTMAEKVTCKVSDMVADIETINNQVVELKRKCYLCSILAGTGIGIVAFEVVRLIISFI